MGRQPPRARQQKKRKRRRRIVVGRHSVISSRRRRTFANQLDLISLDVLSFRGGIGWSRESGRDDECGGDERSDGKSGHDRIPLEAPADVLPDGSLRFKTKRLPARQHAYATTAPRVQCDSSATHSKRAAGTPPRRSARRAKAHPPQSPARRSPLRASRPPACSRACRAPGPRPRQRRARRHRCR
jgi:hypothetical protein